jgi:hypothetical protein
MSDRAAEANGLPPVDGSGSQERPAADEVEVSDLQSGVLTSPADPMLGEAIGRTLAAAPGERLELFTRLVQEIVDFMAAHPEERAWTCVVHAGTDGSTIFRGGIGHSLVIDPAGRLWRARSYEDFATTYRFVGDSCEIDRLTPDYSGMREFLRR